MESIVIRRWLRGIDARLLMNFLAFASPALAIGLAAVLPNDLSAEMPTLMRVVKAMESVFSHLRYEAALVSVRASGEAHIAARLIIVGFWLVTIIVLCLWPLDREAIERWAKDDLDRIWFGLALLWLASFAPLAYLWGFRNLGAERLYDAFSLARTTRAQVWTPLGRVVNNTMEGLPFFFLSLYVVSLRLQLAARRLVREGRRPAKADWT